MQDTAQEPWHAGTCVGDPKYKPAAGLESDGCLTLCDEQIWRFFYKMHNGKDFEPPKPLPAPAAAR